VLRAGKSPGVTRLPRSSEGWADGRINVSLGVPAKGEKGEMGIQAPERSKRNHQVAGRSRREKKKSRSTDVVGN